MMDAAQGQPALVLMVDAQSFSAGVVEVAMELAMAANMRVHGVFVEDEDLLRIAGLPFSREVSLSTAEIRPLNAKTVARALRVQEEQFREFLSKVAEAARVPWSFAVARGRSAVLGMEEGDAILSIVSRAKACRPGIPRARTRRRLLMMGEESPGLQHVLQVLAEMDEAMPLDVVWSHGSSSGVQSLNSDLEMPMHMRFRRVANGDAMVSGKSEFDYVVASRDLEQDLLRRLLKKASCPVILVS